MLKWAHLAAFAVPLPSVPDRPWSVYAREDRRIARLRACTFHILAARRHSELYGLDTAYSSLAEPRDGHMG